MEDHRARESMRESMRKLSLWYTRNFKPLLTHDELEPIMETLGFVSSSPAKASGGSEIVWKEYSYSAGECRVNSPIRPRLPFPRIDGLHIFIYQAFIEAVNLYLEKSDISELFHVRGMPLHRFHDRNRRWRCMEEDTTDDIVYVYREGTLDQATHDLYRFNKRNNLVVGVAQNNSATTAVIRGKKNSSSSSSGGNYRAPITTSSNSNSTCLVALKDMIV